MYYTGRILPVYIRRFHLSYSGQILGNITYTKTKTLSALHSYRGSGPFDNTAAVGAVTDMEEHFQELVGLTLTL